MCPNMRRRKEGVHRMEEGNGNVRSEKPIDASSATVQEVKEFSLPFADLAIRQNEIRTASFGLTPRFYVNPREVVH